MCSSDLIVGAGRLGDRNIMGTEDSEETTITSPFGPMYLIHPQKTFGETSLEGALTSPRRLSLACAHV